MSSAAEHEDHVHSGFEVPEGLADPSGRGHPIDAELLGWFMGAAFEGCTSCQDPLLAVMGEDAATTARLVELACMAVQAALGGLPVSLTEQSEQGLASPEFRELASAGLDGANDAVFDRCEQMNPQQRRAAADTAADLLVGYLTT